MEGRCSYSASAISKEEKVHHHKYEYRIDMDSDHVGPRICRMTGQGKRVLEIGAGPGSITRLLKEHGQCHVTAVELDSEAIEKLSAYCDRVYQCDLNTPDWPAAFSADTKFDVVVAADVLEHLYDPWATLRTMQSLLTDGGCLVVSLPHIGHQGLIASLAAGQFEYQDWGLLDRTHIRFFSIASMQRLFENAGLKILEAEFLVRAPEFTEFAKEWANTPEILKRSLEQCTYGRVYQVVIRAVPSSAAGRSINLVDLAVPPLGPLLPEGASMGTRMRLGVKLIGRRFLSQRIRARLSEVLLRMGLRL